MKIGILAVQGGVAEHERTIRQVAENYRDNSDSTWGDLEVILVRRAAHLEGINGLILPGGESTTMSRLLTLSGMDTLLKEALEAGLPAYGTCAGMILLASEVLDTRPDAIWLSALEIAVRRNAFGRQRDSFEAELAFTGIDEPVHATFIRAPIVEEVSADVEVLCREPEGRIVGVRQANVLATSFHPEVSGVTEVHELFLRMCEDAGFTYTA